MFGLRHNLDDPSLYMLHDSLEGLLNNAKKQLSETPKAESEKIKKLEGQIEYYSKEIADFENEINDLRKQSFQFSVEELYSMHGQYDKFIGIEFHKLSEAAQKFGRNIGGILVYEKTEREILDKIIHSKDISRTNGSVKLRASSNYKLNKDQHRELIQNGFSSGDIYELSVLNIHPEVNAYAQKGRKEIPNTIYVPFDDTGITPAQLGHYLHKQKFTDGYTLIQREWDEFCGYFLYTKETASIGLFKDKIYTPGGLVRKEVRFYELAAKTYAQKISKEEDEEFSVLLRNRTIQRLDIFKEELKRSGITDIAIFVREHPEIYVEVLKSAVTFEDEVLSVYNTKYPVYMDFKSYLHVYLRHCDELQPEGAFKLKSRFQYNQKDIQRVLKIAIENLEDKIEERLSKGLDFRTYGDKGLYYNGNYYALRIESTGRLDSFSPVESFKAEKAVKSA